VSSRTTISRRELGALLSKTVGDAKALSLVDEAATKLRLTSDHYSMDEAMNVLEHIAEIPGLVGVTARFAKSRLYLAHG